MKKILLSILISSFVLMPINVYAECDHDWSWTDNYIKNEDGKTHSCVYKCYDCGNKKEVVEDCDFTGIGKYISNQDGQTHNEIYKCYDCGNMKNVVEDCFFDNSYDYKTNNDGQTHNEIYKCYDCGNTKEMTENCDFEYDGCEEPIYNNNGTHTIIYKCYDCYGEKKVVKKCEFKTIDQCVEQYSASQHIIVKTNSCSTCNGTKTEKTKQKHTIKWYRDGSYYYYYGCKACDYHPKYNGSEISDQGFTDNVTVKKGKTYSDILWYYHDMNKIKSITYSDKSICKFTHTKKKAMGIKLDYSNIKGLKKGKCTVTVKMTSGATYKYKVTVK